VGDRSETDYSGTDRSEMAGDRSARSLPVAGVTDSPPLLFKKHFTIEKIRGAIAKAGVTKWEKEEDR
jgi:hypothetical protein